MSTESRCVVSRKFWKYLNCSKQHLKDTFQLYSNRNSESRNFCCPGALESLVAALCNLNNCRASAATMIQSVAFVYFHRLLRIELPLDARLLASGYLTF